MRRLALTGGTLALVALPALAAPGDTQRASLPDQAGQDTTQPAMGAAVSGDGRLVLFTSRDALTAAGSGGTLQLYLRDRVAGRTRLVSAGAGGQPANADVAEDPVDHPYAISADGRYAVFASTATNLVADDRNGTARDVFRKDLVTGAVTLVSRSTAGAQATVSVDGDPDVSADGNLVAFASGAATSLVPGDESAASDVLVRDVHAGTTVAANVPAAGGAPAGPASRPSLSADGRYVAFETASATLLPGDANGASDIGVRDLAGGALTRGSVAADGTTPGGATSPDLSGDGRHLAFLATTPHTTGAPARPNVYRRDLRAGVTVLASAVDGTAGTAGDGAAGVPAITADGERIAFTTTSTDLVPGDGNGAVADAAVRDVETAATTRVGAGPSGQPAAATTAAAISGGGGVVAVGYDDAGAAPLLPGDTNGRPDVFARELAPTDARGPSVTVTQPGAGEVTAERAVPVAVTATDPSGVASVTVDGRRLTRSGTAFTGTALLPVGDTTLAVVAVDGAGNETRVTRDVARRLPGAPAAAVAARATGLRVTVRGRTLRVAFRLSAPAVVLGDVRRLAAPRTGAASTRVARSRRVWLAPGVRSLAMRIPRLPAGAYRVRVTVVSDGGLTQTALSILVGTPAGAAQRP
ncbi:MAG: hypothetical protein AB1416_07970 [Actinomycetota bacterium]